MIAIYALAAKSEVLYRQGLLQQVQTTLQRIFDYAQEYNVAQTTMLAGDVHERLLEYIQLLLAAFPPNPRETLPPPNQVARPLGTSGRSLGPASRTLVEPLSAHELEVLRLVATGLSNSQIATRLVVTVGTVIALMHWP